MLRLILPFALLIVTGCTQYGFYTDGNEEGPFDTPTPTPILTPTPTPDASPSPSPSPGASPTPTPSPTPSPSPGPSPTPGAGGEANLHLVDSESIMFLLSTEVKWQNQKCQIVETAGDSDLICSLGDEFCQRTVKTINKDNSFCRSLIIAEKIKSHTSCAVLSQPVTTADVPEETLIVENNITESDTAEISLPRKDLTVIQNTDCSCSLHYSITYDDAMEGQTTDTVLVRPSDLEICRRHFSTYQSYLDMAVQEVKTQYGF